MDLALLKTPVGFIESLLRYKGEPFTLHAWQRDLCERTDFLRQNVCLCKARQIGGSLLIAALCVFYASVNPHLTIHVLSKTHAQAGNIFAYLRDFFASNPHVEGFLAPKLCRKNKLVLRNGSKIEHDTLGIDGSNLRGKTIGARGFLVIDESAYAPSVAIESAYPIATGGTVIHCSTPFRPAGAFYAAFNSPHYTSIRVPASMSPRHTPASLARLRDLLPPSKYRMDYLAEFSAGEYSVFSEADIARAIDESLPLFDPAHKWRNQYPAHNYVFSLDPSRLSYDATVWMVAEHSPSDNVLTVRAYHEWRGTSQERANANYNATFTDNPDDVVDTIVSYARDFHCTRFYIDAYSDFYTKAFTKALLNVEPVYWGVQSKARMISHLEACFKADKIRIPNDETLINELLSFAYDLKAQENGGETKRYLAGMDDHVDCLAMAAQEVRADSKDWKDFFEVF